MGSETVSETQKQPKIPAGGEGGSWRRGGSIAVRRMEVEREGGNAEGDSSRILGNLDQNPTGIARAALGPGGTTWGLVFQAPLVNSIVSAISGSVSPERGRDPPGRSRGPSRPRLGLAGIFA